MISQTLRCFRQVGPDQPSLLHCLLVLPISLLSLLVVLEMTMFLDGIQYRHHMHQKRFLGPVVVPHRKVEGGVLFKRHLDLEASHL